MMFFFFFLILFDWISTVWFPRKEMKGKRKESYEYHVSVWFGLVLFLACGKRNELDICVQLC